MAVRPTGTVAEEQQALIVVPTVGAMSFKAASAAAQARPKRAATEIYDRLRKDIISLARLPGSTVSEQLICQELGISRTPVREAILKLQDEGLIDIFPQSGTRVAPITLDALPDIVFYRTSIETCSVRLFAPDATPDDVRALDAIVDAQELHAARAEREAFHGLDDLFHQTLLERAGRGRVWRMIDRHKIHLDRFRRLTLPVVGRMIGVAQDHRAIVRAIESRDGDASATLLRRHLEDVLSVMDLLRTKHADLFD